MGPRVNGLIFLRMKLFSDPATNKLDITAQYAGPKEAQYAGLGLINWTFRTINWAQKAH